MHASKLAQGLVVLALMTMSPASTRGQYRLAHIAGGTETGFAGDGGPAADALLDRPAALTVASDGALLIADTGNQRIRKISPDGLIDTVAGSGATGSLADGVLATQAQLQQPRDVAIDVFGNLYIVDGEPARVRRVDAVSGRIETLLGANLGSYTLANDHSGNVYIAVSTAPWQAPAFLFTRQEHDLAIAPLNVSRSPDWSGFAGRVFGLTARDPSQLFFAYEDYGDYGVARKDGRLVLHYWGHPGELYSLSLPWDISTGKSGGLYFTGQSYYGRGQYVLRSVSGGFVSVAGGGTEVATHNALASRVALAPAAIAAVDNHLIFVVHGAAQIFALKDDRPHRGSISGLLDALPSHGIVSTASVFLIGDDGSYHYASPNRRGRFRFSNLPPGNYRAIARFAEEGKSCDANNCGWSGAQTDCPATLNDPVVEVTTTVPRHRVRLRLVGSTPCI